MVTEYIYIPVQIPHNFYTNIYSGLCDIIHSTIQYYIFPRLDIYGKPLYGNSHYISTENTYQRKLETKFIQKENLVLISQSKKLHT